MTKRKNRTIERRIMRRREKRSDSKQDTMLGRCCRRGYRMGIAK
jgi:hypothetical protein